MNILRQTQYDNVYTYFMNITFHGGAGGVTGSKHLIEYRDTKILLDCGFFRGRRSEARKLNSELPFDASTVDVIVLSHAHLDHCGLLPLMVKQGFAGKIYSTPATKDMAQKMLQDSAGIQESDYAYLKKKRVSGHEKLAKPLYTRSDIPKTMRQFVTHDYVRNGQGWHEILPGVRLKFYDAGHILGSAVSVLDFKVPKGKFRIGYTGDLGRHNVPLLYDPQYVKDRVDVLLCEATYGNRVHHTTEEADDKIIEAVKHVCKHKSKLIVPAFSLGRTQAFVYTLHQLTDSGQIPRIPIYVDSPLAGRVTEVFKKYRHDYDLESREDFPRKGDVPLMFRNLKYTKSREESMALNQMRGPVVIISASGMAEGGRVLHHLKHSLRAKKNLILFTGYQAENTLGRRLIEGATSVRIYGRLYTVNARIEKVNELSAHADSEELFDYMAHITGLKKVFFVHGEKESAQKIKKLMKKRLPLVQYHIPNRGDSYEFPITNS